MPISLKHAGQVFVAWEIADLVAGGVPVATIDDAIEVALQEAIEATAERRRSRIADVSAGKLAEWRIKEEIARDEAAAAADELAQIDREATARDMTRAELLAVIAAQAAAYRRAVLLIGALRAEAIAGIDGIDAASDTADEDLQTALASATSHGAVEFAAALAQITGEPT